MAIEQTIDADNVAKLWATGALREIRAIRQEGAQWALQGRIGTQWLSVSSRRQDVRLWRSLTALERFCALTGARQLTVEL